MALQVRSLQVEDYARWNAFVDSHPQGSPFHLLAWKKTIESVFPYQPHYLIALEGDEVRAVLPLFLVENPVVGRVLLSSPFAVYGGILAESADAQEVMSGYVTALAQRL